MDLDKNEANNEANNIINNDEDELSFIFDFFWEKIESSSFCKIISNILDRDLDTSIKEKFIDMKKRKTGNSKFNFVNSFKFMFKNLLDLLTSINYKK